LIAVDCPTHLCARSMHTFQEVRAKLAARLVAN